MQHDESGWVRSAQEWANKHGFYISRVGRDEAERPGYFWLVRTDGSTGEPSSNPQDWLGPYTPEQIEQAIPARSLADSV